MSNHVAFGGACCLWCVSQELFGFNKYSNKPRQAKPTKLVALKKFPSSIYTIPRGNDQTHDPSFGEVVNTV